MTRRTFLAATLAAQRGSVVLLDVDTGKVLQARREDALARPGSALKPLTLRALIDTARLPADDRLACGRRVSLAGRTLDCTHPVLVRPLNAEEALAYSCNAWFTRMALRLDAGEFYQNLQNAGLGSDGELTRAPSAETLQLQAVGEACVRVTPLELARAYRKLALLSRKGAPALRPLFEGLEGAVRYGTAQAAATKGLTVAGKTGTGEGAWFAGYAPARDPRVVVAVYLEQGRGGADAAPVAGEVLAAWFAQR